MAEWLTLRRDGVRLACRDFGGCGPPVVLLHGLAGHAEEWAETASWLAARCRVVALDARGHGHSERFPPEVSRDAVVADAAFALEELGLRMVVVVGQSLGGITAISLAAQRPDLVRGLVVVEASPAEEAEDAERTVREIGAALRSWPVPFPSRSEAEAFFADRFGGRLAAEAWAGGLQQRPDGWWPRFDVEVMVETLRQAGAKSSWEEWERISCPTLVLRAERGLLAPDVAQAMIARQPMARVAELRGARHDLHLDRPREWRRRLNAFLDSLDQCDRPRQPPAVRFSPARRPSS